MARIVLNTFGSFGDLHPYLGIAVALLKRGHNPVVATSEVYRAKVQAEGVEFAPVRPDLGQWLGNSEMLEKLWDPRRGTELLIREYILPYVEQSYEDLLPVCHAADLLLTHIVGYAGPIVAEVRNLRWLSVALQPSAFLSIYDPPVLAPALWLKHVYKLGRLPTRVAFAMGRSQVIRWAAPIKKLRKRLGLRAVKDPIIRGQFSPYGTLALFSPYFAQPQPDWPRNVRMTGFIFYDRRGEGFGDAADTSMGASLSQFLAAGSAPLLFTLGSSAVMHAGRFYEESLTATRILNRRAVMLVGMADREQLSASSPDSVYIADYAPYSELMPHCAAIVHQGGIGTTAQALRSGRPMLVVPWGHDQPDNAERIRRLGVGGVLPRSLYKGASAARELRRVLDSATISTRAAQIGQAIHSESALESACYAIEAALTAPLPRAQ